MKLVPLADRVVLKQLEAEETTKSGIVLPGAEKEKPQQAEVIAVGPGGMVEGKEIAMQVKVGDQVIELGDTTNLENKFADLLAFYRNGMPRAGWDAYSKISLKFKDQVVCTKK